MKLNQQIKNYRTLKNISQEELADKIFVTRQTISNWETAKSYPDIHSLLLMSNLFDVSLDQLVKGDLNMMKESIQNKSIHNYTILATVFSVMMLGLLLITAPLFYYLHGVGIILWCIYMLVVFIVAFKLEKIKKENDTQTYKEILAFMNGERLDEIQKKQEYGKRPYQKLLSALLSGVVMFIVTMLLLSLFHYLG